MKRIILGLVLVASTSSFAADICEVTKVSNGTTGHIVVTCTDESKSSTSKRLYEISEDQLKGQEFREMKVRKIKYLTEEGYNLIQDGIFIKR